MFKQIIALLFVTASTVYSAGNYTCLNVKLWDMYGDGWAGAMAWLERPNGDMASAYPTCTENPVYRQVCPDDDGKYYIVVNTDDNELPRHYWEIIWTVTVENTTETYTGGFNTTMVWDYDGANDHWSLVYWNNLWPNTKACDGCGDSAACVRKPKPKHHKKKPSPKKRKGKKDGKDDDEEDDVDDDDILSNVTDLTPAPKYGPRAVDLTVTMWDSEGDGWWLDDYTGSSWYISDYSNTVLYDSGTLCDGFSGMCKLCLGDGPYVFRVTGEESVNFTSWDFCHTQGEYGDELHFHVYHGKCYPDVLISRDVVCGGADIMSTIVVEGVLAVSGLSSEVFSTSDAKVFADALATEIVGLSSNNVEVLSTTLDASALNDRKLSTYTHYVNFQFSIIAEELGVDGTNYAFVNNIVNAISTTVENKIVSGEFLSAVSLMARKDGVAEMAQVTEVSLISLSLSSVSYSNTKQLPAGIEMSEGDAIYTHNKEYDSSSIVMFVGAVAVGFAVFAGIVANRMKGYKQLAQESNHGLFEVGMTEIDGSISNPVLSRKGGNAGSLEASL